MQPAVSGISTTGACMAELECRVLNREMLHSVSSCSRNVQSHCWLNALFFPTQLLSLLGHFPITYSAKIHLGTTTNLVFLSVICAFAVFTRFHFQPYISNTLGMRIKPSCLKRVYTAGLVGWHILHIRSTFAQP